MGTLFPSRLLIYFLLSSDDRWRGASARSSALPSQWLRFGCGWGWRKFPDSSGLSSDTEAPGVDETRR
jgi:hypothetical protein